jgi:hypothetical protein
MTPDALTAREPSLSSPGIVADLLLDPVESGDRLQRLVGLRRLGIPMSAKGW